MTAINHINANDIALVDLYGDMDVYQSTATMSAIYPGRASPLGMIYVALKLNGEAGEIAEHVGKAMRDDNLMGEVDVNNGRCDWHMGPDLTPSRRELLVKEVGDCLWYLAAMCNELDITLTEAAVTNLKKLKDRQERGTLQGSGDRR